MIYPNSFPHDLQAKPKLAGEKLVFEALTKALPEDWTCFYDWPVKGSRRRADFLCINPARGIAVFEVKGGLVHRGRHGFRQLVTRGGVRKSIFPFDQAKNALKEALASCGVDPQGIKQHIAAFYPIMSQTAFPFGEGPHVFTREDLEPKRLWAKLAAIMPESPPSAPSACLKKLIDALLK